MAKKIVELTPRQAAEDNAQKLVQLRAKIAELKVQETALEDAILAYYEETGEKELGAVTLERAQTAVKLVNDRDYTKGELDDIQKQLMNELPDYVDNKLDLTKLFNAQRTNTVVANALASRGLRLERGETVRFKIAKETAAAA
jgi:hypothetical protein